MNILQYRQEIHKNNVAKGFWGKGAAENKGERVMLIVSELGECLEAHRNGRTSSIYLEPGNTNIDFLNSPEDSQFLIGFKSCIKGTYEEEMADVVIRILDYCEGFGIDLVIPELNKRSIGNFGHDLLRVVHWLIVAYDNLDTKEQWGYALGVALCFCRWWNIDIEQYVQWKMRYNATRPPKHGKAY